jgi:hypothetical protein
VKVLHLPVNIASQISVTVRALRDIGVDARGLVITNSPIQDFRGIEIPPLITYSRCSINGVLNRLSRWRFILGLLKWADVVHWHFDGSVLRGNLDLWYVSFLNKARIVEFWGSDIRIPDVASTENSYMARMYEENPHLAAGAGERSLRTQTRFARYGFECLLPDGELLPYIHKNLFPQPFMTRQRIMLSDYDPKYPDPNNCHPLIVHTPSHKGAKGTKFVLNAIDLLRSSYDFDFKLIHNVPRDEALSIVQDCDIMLDQFVVGSHGLASLEAMAFGKPTVCYIKPSLIPRYPDDFPIINANQDNLAEVLGGLLKDGQKRYEIGRRSRVYVEKYHDAHRIARDLVNIYQKLLEKV